MENLYKKRRPSYEVHGNLDVSKINNFIKKEVERKIIETNNFTFSDCFGEKDHPWDTSLKQVYDYYYEKTKSHDVAMTKSARDVGWALKNFLIENYDINLEIEKIYKKGKRVNKYIIKNK